MGNLQEAQDWVGHLLLAIGINVHQWEHNNHFQEEGYIYRSVEPLFYVVLNIPRSQPLHMYVMVKACSVIFVFKIHDTSSMGFTVHKSLIVLPNHLGCLIKPSILKTNSSWHTISFLLLDPFVIIVTSKLNLCMIISRNYIHWSKGSTLFVSLEIHPESYN